MSSVKLLLIKVILQGDFTQLLYWISFRKCLMLFLNEDLIRVFYFLNRQLRISLKLPAYSAFFN